MTQAMPEMDAFARFRLDGRAALVTGASAGLGAQFARVLDAARASVVLAARRERELEEQVRRLRRGLAVPCDLTDPTAIQALVARAVDAHGRVDIVVNKAGQTDEMRPALDQRREQFQQVLDVNLVAPFLLAQCAVRQMMRLGGGVILNVASVLGLVAHPEKPQAAYTASKGGLVNLTRELASQWGRHRVRVNALGPGPVSERDDGGIVRRRGLDGEDPGAPLGRAEIGGALLFLVSEASSYVTGQVLVVDGGYTGL